MLNREPQGDIFSTTQIPWDSRKKKSGMTIEINFAVAVKIFATEITAIVFTTFTFWGQFFEQKFDPFFYLNQLVLLISNEIKYAFFLIDR